MNIFIDNIFFSTEHKIYCNHCIFIQMSQFEKENEKFNISIIL